MVEYIRNISSNSLLKNYLKVFSVDVLVKGAGIILLPIYLRLMTQDEFGLYGYIVAIVSTFSLVFNLGIYTAQSKLYHDYSEGQRDVVLGTLNIMLAAFVGLLLLSIFVFEIDYPVVDFLFKNPFQYSEYRNAILLGVVVAVYAMMIINFFLTSGDIKKVQLFNIFRIILVNTVVIAMLFYASPGEGALVRLKYSSVVEFLIIACFSYFYVSKMKFSFNRTVAVRAIAICLPIVTSAILGLFINLSDRFFLEKFGTLRDMSIYNLALSVSSIVPFVFSSFQNIWLPEFLKQKDFKANRARAKKMIARLLVAFILLSIFILAGLKVLLITGVIDEKYDTIMPLLPITLITGIVASLTSMYSNHLIYLDKLYLVIVVGIPIAVLGVLMNISLVPAFGVFGAAVSSLILNSSYLASYAWMVRYFYDRKVEDVT